MLQKLASWTLNEREAFNLNGKKHKANLQPVGGRARPLLKNTSKGEAAVGVGHVNWRRTLDLRIPTMYSLCLWCGIP